jgi:NAD(P)-dependent dehydrogenase (short-subunit alcohol dehydrogenase family)
MSEASRVLRRLENKVCIVTGGAGSIGFAMAERFHAEGASVLLADRDAEGLDARRTAAGMENIATFTADVSRESDVQAMMQAAAERFGGLDVLVNNAAAWRNDGPVTEVAEHDWDAIQAATLKSVYLCSKHAIPLMQARGGGSIVNIASVNAVFGLALAAYTAAKGGVLALTQVMAVMHGREGIRVNAISPGTIRSGSWAPNLEKSPDTLSEWEKRYPLQRIGNPEEVAALAAYLASDESRNTTGANYIMDGGLSAGLALPEYGPSGSR